MGRQIMNQIMFFSIDTNISSFHKALDEQTKADNIFEKIGKSIQILFNYDEFKEKQNEIDGTKSYICKTSGNAKDYLTINKRVSKVLCKLEKTS